MDVTLDHSWSLSLNSKVVSMGADVSWIMPVSGGALIALREGILDASGRLHVVSGCLYHSRSREGQLQVVCNALNLGTSGLLLLGRIHYFLVLQASLHRVFMLKGARIAATSNTMTQWGNRTKQRVFACVSSVL